MAQNIEDLRKKYQAEADLMGSKQRFGFFSIPPSHTAGKTDFAKTKCRKADDGRVSVQPRNIYSGGCSKGVLKKTYFSVPKSIYQGDPYASKSMDKKPSTKSGKQNDKPDEQRQVFKPAKLNKTLAASAYKYICQNPIKKSGKRCRNTDGAVITKERNVFTNSLSKIEQEKMKQFKYSDNLYENQKKLKNKQLLKSILERKGEGPFKLGSPVKEYFSSYIEAFNDHECKHKISKVSTAKSKIVPHEYAFKPSCRPRNSPFSSFTYNQNSITQANSENPSKIHSNENSSIKILQPFKLSNKESSSRPTPSIAYSKINLRHNLR